MSSRKPQPDGADSTDWDAIGRSVAGEGSDADIIAMRQWLATHADDDQFVTTLDAAVQRLAAHNADANAALIAFRRLRDEQARIARNSRSYKDLVRVFSGRRSVIPVALAASMLLAVTLGFWRLTSQRDGALTSAATARTIETRVGARDSVVLPDGSRVLVGPGTRLSIKDGYNATRREIDLNGEAFFDVVRDETRPFIVHAGTAQIRVVGTSFSVRTGSTATVRVLVNSGAVRLAVDADSGGGVVLRAGDEGRLEPDGHVMTARGNLAEESEARNRGWEIVRDAPMSEVVALIRRWYGLELHIPDSVLANRRLSATFTGAPATRMVEMLSLTLGVQAQIHGDTIVLRRDASNVHAR